MVRLLTSCLVLLSAFVAADSTFEPARPPAIPLAVRSPYLTTWLRAGPNGGNGGYLAGEWPTFWFGAVTGWAGFVSVDGETYTWMGKPDPLPTIVNQKSFEYTSTRSSFLMDVAGLVTMNISFLSPVSPQDEKRQSYPVTYLTVEVVSADGKDHDVSIYTDVSAEWAGGNRSAVVKWEYDVAETADGNVAYHKFALQTPDDFGEKEQQASWGNWYYAARVADGLTFQSGADQVVRGNFINNGTLPNTKDTNFRAISDSWPVFAYAQALGSVGKKSVSATFTISLAQQGSIRFRDQSGLHSLPSLWTSYFDDEISALSWYYNDLPTVSDMASALDTQVAADSAAAGGDNYVTLTALAVRQAFGALVHVVDYAGSKYIFLKEISSNGDIQTVDVIFPFFPILMYFNPSWISRLLDPLFVNQLSDIQPVDEKYALHDLGTFPHATGYPNGGAEAQPIEECGNMNIMVLAYAQRTGDVGYLNKYYDLLVQWTDYLVEDSLYPSNQISTDDFAGFAVNQTDLALKGIIGIQAMATMANMTGHQDQGANYSTTAESYIAQWVELGDATGASVPHTTFSYNDKESWGLLYNLYADALLDTRLVPKQIYQKQSDYYPTVANKYGVPLKTNAKIYTKSDWEMFCAAIAEKNTTDMFIEKLANWINETPTSGPATDLFMTDTGDYGDGPFLARPVVGGWFALLALNQTGIPGY